MKSLRTIIVALLLSLTASAVLAGPVNINTADAQTLASELNGVGLTKAQAIVEFRDANGQFMTVDELAKVRGIGLATVEKNRDNILVDDEG